MQLSRARTHPTGVLYGSAIRRLVVHSSAADANGRSAPYGTWRPIQRRRTPAHDSGDRRRRATTGRCARLERMTAAESVADLKREALRSQLR